MGFRSRSAAKATIEVHAGQNKFYCLVHIDGIQFSLENQFKPSVRLLLIIITNYLHVITSDYPVNVSVIYLELSSDTYADSEVLFIFPGIALSIDLFC